jgi:hypothetical protein
MAAHSHGFVQPGTNQCTGLLVMLPRQSCRTLRYETENCACGRPPGFGGGLDAP